MKFTDEQILEAWEALRVSSESALISFHTEIDHRRVSHERDMIEYLGEACKALGVTVDADGDVTQVNLPAGEENQPVVNSDDPAGIPKLGGDAEVQF